MTHRHGRADQIATALAARAEKAEANYAQAADDRERLEAEVATLTERLARAEQERDRHGECACEGDPGTAPWPDEFCPQHGRPYTELLYLVASDVKGMRDALARVEALAERLSKVPDYTDSDYDQGRVDQRHGDATALHAALWGDS